MKSEITVTAEGAKAHGWDSFDVGDFMTDGEGAIILKISASKFVVVEDESNYYASIGSIDSADLYGRKFYSVDVAFTIKGPHSFHYHKREKKSF